MRPVSAEIDWSYQRHLVVLAGTLVDILAVADTYLDLVLDIPVHIDILLAEDTFEVDHIVVGRRLWELDLVDMLERAGTGVAGRTWEQWLAH